MQQPIQGATGPKVYVMVDNEQKETLFAKKLATVLSIVQIILGVTSIICQIVIIIFLTIYSTSYRDFIGGIGQGIYCGIFYVIAGSLGLLASCRPTTCNISAFMTLSIIASVFSAIQIINSSINLSVVSYAGWDRIHLQEPKMAMFSIMIIAGLAEGVIAIICSAICCKACCCTGGGATGRVVYLAQGESSSGVEGGAPVQIAYLPQSVPVIGALDQKPSELPSYGDVVNVKEEPEVEGTQKIGSKGYNRF